MSATEPSWPVPSPQQTLADLTDRTNTGRIESTTTKKANLPSDVVAGGDPLARLVRSVPICIVGSSRWSGELGPSVLYRVRRFADEQLRVGYFVYFTTERPFGDKLLAREVLPAIAIDAVYSHLLFVAPGLQRLIYGAGDIEGVSVTYRIDDSRRLVPVGIVADDAQHRLVSLAVTEAFDSNGYLLLYDEVWSHQLGASRARARAGQSADRRCFGGAALQRLSPEVAAAFRLGSPEAPRRATPAWL